MVYGIHHIITLDLQNDYSEVQKKPLFLAVGGFLNGWI